MEAITVPESVQTVQISKSDESVTTTSPDDTAICISAENTKVDNTIKHPAVSGGVLRDYLAEYLKLSSKTRKRVLSTLMYWGGWTKSSVYRKLQCPNLSPIEEVLVSSVMDKAIAAAEGTQLQIDFEFTAQNGLILLPE